MAKKKKDLTANLEKVEEKVEEKEVINFDYIDRGDTIALTAKGTKDKEIVDTEDVFTREEVLRKIAMTDVYTKMLVHAKQMLTDDLEDYKSKKDLIMGQKDKENQQTIKNIKEKIKPTEAQIKNWIKEITKNGEKQFDDLVKEQEAKINYITNTLTGMKEMKEALMGFLEEEKQDWFIYINENYDDAHKTALLDFESKGHKTSS